MPVVKSKAVLESVYRATLKIGREAPTTPFDPMSTVFRYVSQRYFVVDEQRHIMRRSQADSALLIRPSTDDTNRYTGIGPGAASTSRGGLYCSVQPQATINERAYYVQRDRETRAGADSSPFPLPVPRTEVLVGQYVIKFHLLGRWLAADLSPRHNPGALGFLRRIGADREVQNAIRSAGCTAARIEELINHPDDCSVARGIGLALDQTGWQALIVETARQSERSSLERGDNVIFFGQIGSSIRNLSPEEAWAFPPGREPVRYPIEF